MLKVGKIIRTIEIGVVVPLQLSDWDTESRVFAVSRILVLR